MTKGEEKFKEAQEAYEVLSDTEKKSAYDQFGHAGVDQSGGGHGGAGFSDVFGDVFGDIFGGGGRSRSGPARGSDLRYDLQLDLEDAVEQDRANRGSTLVHCDVVMVPELARDFPCNLQYLVEQVRFVCLRASFWQQTCPNCRGRGKIISDPCGACGQGGGRSRYCR